MSKVPKLRFKEFKDAWDSDFIGNVAKVTSGGTPNRNIKQYWDGGNIPWITTSVIDSNVIDKAEEFISEEGVKNSSAKIFPVGTILMAMYGQGKTRGKVSLLGIEATTNQACAAILVNKKLSSLYLFQNLGGRYEEIRGLSNEGGQQNLSGDIIKKIKIRFPSLPEQQKIASFLSAVDEKIQQLTRKKELLAEYKKGVMQQLFSGKLRFKDPNGKPYPNWEEKKLGEILDYIQPTKYLVESTEYDDSFETPVLTAGKTFILGYTNETLNIYDEKLPVIIFDDFTTAIQFVDFPFKAKSSAMKILVAKDNENISFVFNAMQLIKFEVGGHGRHWISQYSQIEIPYPCLEEQQKIASFLTALDAKIESVAAQIAHTQTFKKGLLQQMFV